MSAPDGTGGRVHVSLAYEGGGADSAPADSSAAASSTAAHSTPSGTGAVKPPAAPVPFAEVGRVPIIGDNVAVAVVKVDAGTVVVIPAEVSGAATETTAVARHTVLEGHRFAVTHVPTGGKLTSWGEPLGFATRDIAPGEYIANESIIAALALRRVPFELPEEGCFRDYIPHFELDEASFAPGKQVEPYPASEMRYFEGFPRKGGRGVGTRNYVVVLAVSSRGGALARGVATRCKKLVRRMKQGPRGAVEGFNVDGVVAVSHTEAGSADAVPNNVALVLSALVGWASHPNVAGCVVIDHDEVGEAEADAGGADDGAASGASGASASAARPGVCWKAMQEHAVSVGGGAAERLAASNIRVVRPTLSFADDVASSVAAVEELLADPTVAVAKREPRPLSDLKVALQCGGSDAFSGISANPLVGFVARELVKYGGAALLAETDELIGAEDYITSNVRDLATAKRFVEFVRMFKERLAHHGKTAEANPSGGNKYRGLYNIVLKSLGAAQKKPADVRLDSVLDYGEHLPEAGGYCFMNSPGNDLESIAGQVATGCNMVFFTTGNGAITNFPFVPTIKVITTTGRWNLLKHDMDFNAGEYQDGTPMSDLGMRLLNMAVDAASGTRTVGERAGHSQVSIWRDWAHTAHGTMDAEAAAAVAPSHEPLVVKASAGRSAVDAMAAVAEAGLALPEALAGRTTERVALLLPTSLCSGQVARLIAAKLNNRIRRERGGDGISVGSSGFGGVDDYDEDDEALETALEVAAATRGGCAVGAGDDGSAAASVAAAGDVDADGAEGADTDPRVRMSDFVSRFVALPHSEGCGSEGAEWIYSRVVLGHLSHPSVTHAVLLEHGCEKHHNATVQDDMRKAGLDPDAFGWASVQLDGGIKKVTRVVENLFERSVKAGSRPSPSAGAPLADANSAHGVGAADAPTAAVPFSGVVVGMVADEKVPPLVSAALACVAFSIVDGGGHVVVPQNSTLLQSAQFLDELLESRAADGVLAPTLGFAERVATMVGSTGGGHGTQGRARLHVMEAPTKHWVETLTGLASAGCNLAVGYATRPRQGHPIMPLVLTGVAQLDAEGSAAAALADPSSPLSRRMREFDVVLSQHLDMDEAAVHVDSDVARRWAAQIVAELAGVAAGKKVSRAFASGNIDFQISRGRGGVSV